MPIFAYNKALVWDAYFAARPTALTLCISEMAMNFEFVADEAGTSIDLGVIATGVKCAENYLLFQRFENRNDPDDDGVYIEFNSQLHAGCNCVKKVILCRESLKIELSENLNELEDIGGFFVNLKIDDDQYDSLKAGLEATFWDKLEDLEVNA